ERIKSVIDIVRPIARDSKIVLIFSAFGGVTDTLIQLSNQALTADANYRVTIKALEDRHLDAVRSLISVRRQSAILATVKTMINELEDVIHGIFLVKERTARMLDFVMSFGER